MKIGNNPQKQLYENTKDIEYLLERVREAFHFNGVLSPTDTTCARNGITVNFGYILDDNANLFKFNDGDSSTLLIQYLTNIKGVKGDSGSQYVVEANPEEDATEDLTKLKVDNTVYNVVGSSGGKKYRHCIKVQGTINAGGSGAMTLFIDSDSNKKFVKNSDYVEGTNQNLQQWLIDHTFDDPSRVYPASVCKYSSGGNYTGVYVYTSGETQYFGTVDGVTWTYFTGTTVYDTVIE